MGSLKYSPFLDAWVFLNNGVHIPGLIHATHTIPLYDYRTRTSFNITPYGARYITKSIWALDPKLGGRYPWYCPKGVFCKMEELTPEQQAFAKEWKFEARI